MTLFLLTNLNRVKYLYNLCYKALINESIMALPVVDYTADDAPQRFVKSARETGFGILINHLIEQSLVNSIYQNWQKFFNTKSF